MWSKGRDYKKASSPSPKGEGEEAFLTLKLFYTQASIRQLLYLWNNASEVIWTGMTS